MDMEMKTNIPMGSSSTNWGGSGGAKSVVGKMMAVKQ